MCGAGEASRAAAETVDNPNSHAGFRADRRSGADFAIALGGAICAGAAGVTAVGAYGVMFPIAAGGSALSYLTALLQSSAASTSTASSGSQAGATDCDGDQSPAAWQATGTNTAPLDSGVLATLISLQGQSGAATATGNQGSSGLFAKLDTDGDGQISQSEFESAMSGIGVDQSSADAIFSKLDANGDGNVSQNELQAAHHGHGHHHYHMANSADQDGTGMLLNSGDTTGATATSTTNPDGSTTTTITYADTSTVSMTTPATLQDTASSNSDSSAGNTTGNTSATTDPSNPTTASSASGTGATPFNLLEQLIALQAQLLSQSAATQSASLLSTTI